MDNLDKILISLLRTEHITYMRESASRYDFYGYFHLTESHSSLGRRPYTIHRPPILPLPEYPTLANVLVSFVTFL